MTDIPDKWLQYTVAGRREEAQDVVTFTLACDAEVVHSARAGHHLIIRSGLDGEPCREYSISKISAGILDITVRRDGIVSTWLHAHVEPGATLIASRPRGAFLLSTTHAPLVLLSCGIGVTPTMAMASEALAHGRPTYFIHVARDRSHHAFKSRIDELRAINTDLKTHVTYKYGDADLADHSGEFTVDQLKELLPEGPVEVKICGPSRFMQAMYEACIDLGIARENIGWEAFGPSTVIERDRGPQAAITENVPMVTFAESDLSVQWDETLDNLLEFAEEQGVFPDFSCRQGSCESCMTAVNSGQFEYIDEPFERPPDGYVLLCCSRPTADIELAV